MDKLFFELRPSLTKLGLSVGLFILLNAILSNYIGGLVLGLVMLACLFILYFLHDRNPVQQLAHLDQKTWSLKFKDGKTQQYDLVSLQSLGVFIFIKFEDENRIRRTVCVTKDQLDILQWKKLYTLVKII